MSDSDVRCRRCSSEKVTWLDVEAILHLPGLRGLHQAPIWAYPKLLVCLVCGFAEGSIPQDVVQTLVEAERALKKVTASARSASAAA